jgi:5-methylcytosine-specific restriction protein A
MAGGWEGSDRKHELPPDWNSVIRPRILRRDPICRICHERLSTQVDHRRRGNDHRDGNLQGICDPCHSAKSSREGNDAQRAIRSARWRPQPPHPGVVR